MVKRSVKKHGVPLGRTGDALNAGLAPCEDAKHRVGGPFPYEWWYFDASFENGYSAVAIIWAVNYSKPWSRQCTIQLSIYGPGGEKAKHYIYPPRRLFSASYQALDVRVGESYMRGRHPSYDIYVEAEGDWVELHFEAQTPGWRPGTGVNHFPLPRYNSMGWLVPVPRAVVDGRLGIAGRTVEVSGHGYHDHNWGEGPFFHVVDNWHWGHVVSGEIGITWSDITMSRWLDYDRAYMFLLSRGPRLMAESDRLLTRYSGWVKDPAYLHPYPSEISVEAGDDGEYDVRLDMEVLEVIETQDLLDMSEIPVPLKEFSHRFVARPYYFRWRSAIRGEVRIGPDSYPVGGETIHEQMLLKGRRPAELASL